jgi:hypothetical protein
MVLGFSQDVSFFHELRRRLGYQIAGGSTPRVVERVRARSACDLISFLSTRTLSPAEV